jgi:hypothetical protein
MFHDSEETKKKIAAASEGRCDEGRGEEEGIK